MNFVDIRPQQFGNAICWFDYLKPKWLGPSKITHPNIHAYDCVLKVLTPPRNANIPSDEVLNTNAIFTAPFFTAQ